jgi:hypothetical protein
MNQEEILAAMLLCCLIYYYDFDLKREQLEQWNKT